MLEHWTETEFNIPACPPIVSLTGTPVQAETSYDISAYIKNGEGNLDSDVKIAKLALALALETDVAIA
jgi:hypothetical protein